MERIPLIWSNVQYTISSNLVGHVQSWKHLPIAKVLHKIIKINLDGIKNLVNAAHIKK